MFLFVGVCYLFFMMRTLEQIKIDMKYISEYVNINHESLLGRLTTITEKIENLEK